MSMNAAGSHSGGRIGNEPIEGWRAVLTVALRCGLGKRKGTIRGLNWDLRVTEAAGDNATAGANASDALGEGSGAGGKAAEDDMEVDNITAMVDTVKSRGVSNFVGNTHPLLRCV